MCYCLIIDDWFMFKQRWWPVWRWSRKWGFQEMRVCDSVILASAKWLGQDSGVAHGMLKLWLAWSQDEDAQLLALWQSSQTDTQGGIWGHTIILYYFGSHVELVHIMSRATILPSLITFHLWVIMSNIFPLFFSCVSCCAILFCTICNFSFIQ